ncbi:MAG TPA: hypothetical protein VLC71_11195 [Thermomonas sp.]|nr:hypothetical protein [Thermomonas sp.]
MARTIAAMDNANIPDRILARTAPTWEVELLISGVAVFAMLQLPGWLDDRMFAMEPRVDNDWRMVLSLAYFYAKSAAVVLAVTFALHLLLRAQWIALVGMDSVYPQGVRLDKLRMGPIQRGIEEALPDSTADAIERADNRASVVFAIGVSVALIIASVCVTFCGLLLLAILASQALGWTVEPLSMLLGVFLLILGPFLAASAVDHLWGARLRKGDPSHRALSAVLRFYTRIGMGRSNNRIVAILSSNGGERKIMAVVVGVMIAAILWVFAAYYFMRNGSGPGSYGYFPRSDGIAIEPANYDDQRDPGRDRPVPYVQSTVVTGPYLRLVVPYRPTRDEAAMRASCGHADALADGPRATARLACLSALHAVALDGRAVEGLRYEVASDPRTDRPALLAMIDVRDLPRGRHELRVARPLRADARPGKDAPDPGYDRIPFWR